MHAEYTFHFLTTLFVEEDKETIQSTLPENKRNFYSTNIAWRTDRPMLKEIDNCINTSTKNFLWVDGFNSRPQQIALD